MSGHISITIIIVHTSVACGIATIPSIGIAFIAFNVHATIINKEHHNLYLIRLMKLRFCLYTFIYLFSLFLVLLKSFFISIELESSPNSVETEALTPSCGGVISVVTPLLKSVQFAFICPPADAP